MFKKVVGKCQAEGVVAYASWVLVAQRQVSNKALKGLSLFVSVGRMRRFNSSCSAVRAHSRTETCPLFLCFPSGDDRENASRIRGADPRLFPTCNNTRWALHKFSLQ
jgi:hypothetical protein